MTLLSHSGGPNARATRNAARLPQEAVTRQGKTVSKRKKNIARNRCPRAPHSQHWPVNFATRKEASWARGRRSPRSARLPASASDTAIWEVSAAAGSSATRRKQRIRITPHASVSRSDTYRYRVITPSTKPAGRAQVQRDEVPNLLAQGRSARAVVPRPGLDAHTAHFGRSAARIERTRPATTRRTRSRNGRAEPRIGPAGRPQRGAIDAQGGRGRGPCTSDWRTVRGLMHGEVAGAVVDTFLQV